MKNVLLLGATGTLGQAVTERLSKNSELNITLFARHRAANSVKADTVKFIEGDASVKACLAEVIRDADVIVCMISGYQLPQIAENIVSCMNESGKKRLIFTGAVGIYDEIPADNGGQFNVSNEPPQVPNRKAVDILEASDLDYTILRPGFLREGDENDYVLSFKGESARGYVTTIPSLVLLIERLVNDDALYVRESVSITKDMRCG